MVAGQKGILVDREAGDLVVDPPDWVRVKLYGEETGGAISIIEQQLAPGSLVPAHVHDHDVWLFVLGAEVGVRVADEIVAATPGALVHKPRDIPHTIWNAGAVPNRFIEMFTPAGFEHFYEPLGAMLRAGESVEAIARMGETYGWHAFPDWTDELKERFGLHIIGEPARS